MDDFVKQLEEAHRRIGQYTLDSYEGIVSLPISFTADLRHLLDRAAELARKEIEDD